MVSPYKILGMSIDMIHRNDGNAIIYKMVNIEGSHTYHQNARSNMSLILRNTIYSTIFAHTNLNELNFFNVER